MPAESLYSLFYKKENAHGDPIYCGVWRTIKPNGESKEPPQDYIVTGGLDGIVKVWKVNEKKFELLHSLEEHLLAIISIAISPDGHTIATTSLDSQMIIWDLTSGKKVYDVVNAGPDTWKATFSPDGYNIVSSGHSGKLAVYSVEKNTVVQYLDTREKFAVCVAWSKDGKHIASGSINGKVCIFNVAQGKLVHGLDAHTHTVTSVDFSPNCKQLATSSKDGFVKIFDVASGNNQYSLQLKQWILILNFSPDGKRLVTGNADGQVIVTSTEGLKIIYSFHEHSSMVFAVQFNTKGKRVVSVAKDKSINVYDCPIPKSDS